MLSSCCCGRDTLVQESQCPLGVRGALTSDAGQSLQGRASSKSGHDRNAAGRRKRFHCISGCATDVMVHRGATYRRIIGHTRLATIASSSGGGLVSGLRGSTGRLWRPSQDRPKQSSDYGIERCDAGGGLPPHDDLRRHPQPRPPPQAGEGARSLCGCYLI